MPKNKNAYVRYLIIHSEIRRKKYKYGYPTLENLKWELVDQGYDVSLSTIEKDINFLKYERQAPIIYDRGQRCYRYTGDWEFDMPITPDDVRMLHMLIDTQGTPQPLVRNRKGRRRNTYFRSRPDHQSPGS
jgi:hypothetical protein